MRGTGVWGMLNDRIFSQRRKDAILIYEFLNVLAKAQKREDIVMTNEHILK